MNKAKYSHARKGGKKTLIVGIALALATAILIRHTSKDTFS